MVSEEWKDYIQTPEGGYSRSNNATIATPSRLRELAYGNLSNQQSSNEKKRGPSTPLTPTLIQKNIVKKQLSSFERERCASLKADDTKDEIKTLEFKTNASGNQHISCIDDELENQEKQEQYLFSNSNKGSPISKKSTPLGLRKSDQLNREYENLTPKIRNGIKLAVRESKRSRLQIVRDLSTQDASASDGEYSEISTIAGDTPNYKIQDENLIYYKNGYYLNNDDSIYEIEKENIINKKEMSRMNNLLEFMQLERKFENDL